MEERPALVLLEVGRQDRRAALQDALELRPEASDDREVREGSLRCMACTTEFVLRRGVPELLHDPPPHIIAVFPYGRSSSQQRLMCRAYTSARPSFFTNSLLAPSFPSDTSSQLMSNSLLSYAGATSEYASARNL